MENVLLSEVRPVIYLWSLVAGFVLLGALIYQITMAEKYKHSDAVRRHGTKIVFVALTFVLLWSALLPFVVCMYCGVSPDIQEWSFFVIVGCLALYILLASKSSRRK